MQYFCSKNCLKHTCDFNQVTPVIYKIRLSLISLFLTLKRIKKSQYPPKASINILLNVSSMHIYAAKKKKNQKTSQFSD